MAKDFNKNHPELRKGEVFIVNICSKGSSRVPQLGAEFGWLGDNRSDWECIGWKTKRMGNVAYDIYGSPLSGATRPVFAKRTELKKAGLNPDKL